MHHSQEERNAVRAMLRRAAVVASNDSGPQQLFTLSGLASEQLKGVVRVQDFGVSSNPPVGGEGLIVCPGGRSDRAMFIGGEHPQFRPANSPAGTTVLYDSSGNTIFAKGQSGIVVQAKNGTITVIPPAGQNIYLGGDGVDGVYQPVQTASGVAMNVMARVS
jgi:phage baseplate assembly protein V